MSPYPAAGDKTQSRFPSHHSLHNRKQTGLGGLTSQPPSSGLSAHRNEENIPSLSNRGNQSQSQSLLWSSPNRTKGTAVSSAVPTNKFSNLPSKSHTISGLGMVSPLPVAAQSDSRLESVHNGSMLLQSDGPVSPIRPSGGVGQQIGLNHTLPLNQALNSTQNTLDISSVNPVSGPFGGNETRMSVHRPARVAANGPAAAASTRIEHDTQITIIGFPAGDGTAYFLMWFCPLILIDFMH